MINQELINKGIFYLDKASIGTGVSAYLIMATISANHCIAPSFDETNWRAILSIYDLILRGNKNVVVELNRLVVVDQLYGTETAYERLLKLEDKSLSKNYLYYSIKGDFEKKLDLELYKESITRAIELTANVKEKEFLKAKL